MAWTSSRRVDDEKIFIRVNYQFLPNGSFHSYLFEDGSNRNHFSRTHMFRWVVPVDDENCIMFGWRMFGSHCDPRGVGKKHLVGFEKMDFLEGQCGMRRPERLQYGQGDLPPVPKHHRERTAYRDAQHAPGDYEAVTSSRKVAVHALEHLLPFDGGVTMFRQLLRLVIDGKSPGATPEAWRDWLADGPPNSYCSGNVLVIPRAPTMAEEIERRREVAKRVLEGHHRGRRLAGRGAQAVHAGPACGNRGDVRAGAGRGLMGERGRQTVTVTIPPTGRLTPRALHAS